MSKAGLLEEIRAVARAHGYAIGLHGSELRDLDLIAAPWSEECSEPDELVNAIEEALGLVATRWRVAKPHGRLGYILHGRRWRDGGEHQPIDLSVMPPCERRSMAERTQPKVKAAAVGAGIGGAAAPIVQISAYYLTPLVPADIKEPVFLLLGMAITGGLSALGAWWAGWLKAE